MLADDSFRFFVLVLAAVAVERWLELRIARRNLAWARERGAVEWGRSHYPWMVALHTLLLPSCVAEVVVLERSWVAPLGLSMVAVVALTMVLRYWVIATLGRRWNTRVVLIPGEPLAVSGPYRFHRHPNYLAVGVEIVALPLIHSAWLTALVFGVANALLLRRRIAVENRALEIASSGNDEYHSLR